jgi:hypothetical protein
MFIYFFYFAEVDPKFVNVDGLAGAAGQAVLDIDLKFLRSSYGILIVIAVKYIIWPFIKLLGGRLLRNCKYYFFLFFFYFFIFIFFIFIISGRWWNDAVRYFNPPPEAAPPAPPPNLSPLEELLQQQLLVMGEIRGLLLVDRVAPVLQVCEY